MNEQAGRRLAGTPRQTAQVDAIAQTEPAMRQSRRCVVGACTAAGGQNPTINISVQHTQRILVEASSEANVA